MTSRDVEKRQLVFRSFCYVPAGPFWMGAAENDPPIAPSITLKANPLPQRRYPWGNEPDLGRANTAENGLRRTTPVTAYPRGASPYGVEDLVGNLWEMTRTSDALRERYEWDQDDTPLALNLYPMYRGGAFFESQDGRARITARTVLHPNRRTPGDGVRLVLIPDAAPRSGSWPAREHSLPLPPRSGAERCPHACGRGRPGGGGPL